MLRREDFPKEPIEILKDVLSSEEFKEIASLNQERLRCIAEADGLMGEAIGIESKLLAQVNKIRNIEAEIAIKNRTAKMQEADRACTYELFNDSCFHESPEVIAYQSTVLLLREEYPEQCNPSNKLVEAFKRYSQACEAFLGETTPKGKIINEEVTNFLTQRKFDAAFRQAVNTIISDNSRETRLLEQEKTIEDCKNKLAALRQLFYYFAHCGENDESNDKRRSLAKIVSSLIFPSKDSEEEEEDFWRDSAKDLFEILLFLFVKSYESDFYDIIAMTQDAEKFSRELEKIAQDDQCRECSESIRRFLSNSEATKAGIVAHMNTQLLGFIYP